MRAFGWLSAISLAAAACTAPLPPAPSGGTPRRVVSLNLCTDELLLLLGAPDQIASVSHLVQRPEESALWERAQRYAANDGSLAAATNFRPDLVLTMGGVGDRLTIARQLGIPMVDLALPQTLDDVRTNIRRVAAALARPTAAEALLARIDSLQATAPAPGIDTIWIGGGGRTVRPAGLEAQWMALAGYRQRPLTGDQLQLEELLAHPPQVLMRSDYREQQYSRQQAWLNHPLAGAAGRSVTVTTDGRAWTCAGPMMIDEVEKLRRERPR